MPGLWLWLLLAFLGLFPYLAPGDGGGFYLGFLTKIMIYSIAASSLNLILGYGGMVSFGHALYFGSSAYLVAILTREGVEAFWVIWTLPLVFSAALAFLIGLVVLRTKGLYFIMITFAFAQMGYYLVISLKQYGGEDGLPAKRVNMPFFHLGDTTYYYMTLIALAITLMVLHIILQSRFGLILQAIKENELRALVLGYDIFRIKLIAFVISGAFAGLAGMLMAQYAQYVTPYHLSWHFSGHLLMMVILGGVGRFSAGVLGATALSMAEEFFQTFTTYWQLFVGLFMLGVLFFTKGGLARLLGGGR